nr:hypothetical protein [Pandoravirus massiliensis]
MGKRKPPMSVSSFRAFFALDVDPAIVAREAYNRAVCDDTAGALRAYAIHMVRVDRMPTEPPMWLQCRPHWGIVVNNTLYHLLIRPGNDDNDADISSAVCDVAWVSWILRCRPRGVTCDGDHRFGSRWHLARALVHCRRIWYVPSFSPPPTWSTRPRFFLQCQSHVYYHQLRTHTRTLWFIPSVAGGDRDPHRLFWHAPTFMCIVVAALCGRNAGDIDRVSSDLAGFASEDDLMYGIFAISRRTRLQVPAPPGPDDWAARSSCEMARHLPIGGLPLSNTTTCILY